MIIITANPSFWWLAYCVFLIDGVELARIKTKLLAVGEEDNNSGIEGQHSASEPTQFNSSNSSECIYEFWKINMSYKHFL
jgi:hypothetical protein